MLGFDKWEMENREDEGSGKEGSTLDDEDLGPAFPGDQHGLIHWNRAIADG